MSSTKNFGLDGIAASVQFGKGGVRLTSASGSLRAQNTAGNALVPVKIGAPTADDEAVTRLLLNSETTKIKTAAGLNGNGDYVANSFTNYLAAATGLKNADELLDAALAALQTELNTTQTGAGLGATGTYTAPGGSNYLTTATSLSDAAVKLDAALKLISNELNTSQTGAGLNADGTYTPPTSTVYLTGATSLNNAAKLLDTATANVQAELNTSQTSLGLTSTGALPSFSGTSYLAGATTMFGAITTLDTQVKSTNDALAALGSVFEYKGSLNGGASAGTAYDLDGLPGDPGDYYKVGTSGHFEYGGTTFYANTSDGIVKNTTGGWDKIDNTDSVVLGTANRISVSGNVDTGFTVNIDTAYVGQNTITTLGTVTTGTWNATTIAVNRGGTGQTAYTTGDLLVGSGSSLAKLARGTSKQVLRTNAAGTNLEWAGLAAADVSFSSGLYVATDVSAALIEVLTELNTTQTGAGLGATGAYTANGTAHYISGASSLKNADDILDQAIYDLTGSLANLATDKIQSASTYYSVVTTNTQTEFYGNVSGAKTLVGTLQSSNLTNSRFKLDLTAAGKVALKAESGSATDVDLVLSPLGAGVIDASSKRVSNVANPSVNADAMNYGSAKSMLTSYKTINFSEANAPVSLGVINGLTQRVTVKITNPLAAPTTVTVGTAADNDMLVTMNDIDHAVAGVYLVDVVETVNANVSIYISGSGSGSGTVIVEYLAAA